MKVTQSFQSPLVQAIGRSFKPSAKVFPSPQGEGRSEGERSDSRVREALIRKSAKRKNSLIRDLTRSCLLIVLLSFFILPPFAFATANNSLTDSQLLQIKFDQRLNAQVSPDLVFRDETGKEVRLGEYLGKRPVVLILGYYTCPMLCSLVVNGATEAFRDLKWSVGRQFDVVFVSIEPSDGPAAAVGEKKVCLRVYGRSGSENGWHFLTDTAASRPDPAVQKLANEIGFHFAYDSGLKQYAHPSGFVVLTPDGRVSHYFFGVNFSPDELDAALRKAAGKKIGSPVQEFILLCCQYSPLRGKYGNFIMAGVRLGGVATLIGLGVLLLRPVRPKEEAAK